MILSGLTWVAIGAAVSDCTRHGGNYDALQGRFYLGFMIVTGAILPWCGILASPVPFRTLFAAGILYSRGVNTPTLGSLFKMDVLYYWYDRTYSEKP